MTASETTRPGPTGHKEDTERLVLLGRLAPAVVHEVNTLIGIALTSATLGNEKLARVRKDHEAGTLTRQKFEKFLESSERVNTVLAETLERCGQLIGSFRQVSVDQSAGAVRRVGLAKLINDTVRSLHPFLRRIDHEVTVNCPPDLTLETDPGLLSRVLINLLLNSVYHAGGGPEGPPLTLRITADTEDDELLLTYGDDGKGIPAEHLDRAFEPYFTTRAGEGGSGLGLAIVREAIETTLGGQLTLTSEPGQGVAFRMKVPLKTYREED